MSLDKKTYDTVQQHMATLYKAGWDATLRDAKAAAMDHQVYVYLWDRPSEFLWLAAIPRSLFVTVALKGSSLSEQEQATIRNGLAVSLNKLVESGNSLSLDDDEELGLLCAMYAGSTKAYALAEDFPDGGHFLILHYRSDAFSSDGRLRPAAIQHKGELPCTPLPPESINEMVHSICQKDWRRHPEWFF